MGFVLRHGKSRMKARGVVGVSVVSYVSSQMLEKSCFDLVVVTLIWFDIQFTTEPMVGHGSNCP